MLRFFRWGAMEAYKEMAMTMRSLQAILEGLDPIGEDQMFQMLSKAIHS